eukprot:scaffold6480_cov125-Skeletonema_marinoi.AAC.2
MMRSAALDNINKKLVAVKSTSNQSDQKSVAGREATYLTKWLTSCSAKEALLAQTLLLVWLRAVHGALDYNIGWF